MLASIRRTHTAPPATLSAPFLTRRAVFDPRDVTWAAVNGPLIHGPRVVREKPGMAWRTDSLAQPDLGTKAYLHGWSSRQHSGTQS